VKQAKYIVLLILVGIGFWATFWDFEGSNETKRPTNTVQIQGSEWEYSCGNPNIFQKVIFYEDSICQYISKDVNGKIVTAMGIYRTQGDSLLGIRYYRGERNLAIDFSIFKIPERDNYYFAEEWDEGDVRYFVKKQHKRIIEEPSFINSKWVYSCGNPTYYEKLEFMQDSTVKYSNRLPNAEPTEALGSYTLLEKGKFANTIFNTENRNFTITYEMYQRESDGLYYIIEKWNDLDMRYFVLDQT